MRLWMAMGVLAVTLPAAPAADFNYAEALQKCLYFYEAQQSGQLSPNNRVVWRGPACLTDGQDIGRDLSGGWFDAGDHWTANLTMAFAATTLAWSAIEQPEGWLRTGQMDELLESLIHVNRYFVRCVLNPNCADPATELDVAIGCGGREGVESPNVHAMWAPAEVAHLMTNRPTFRLNRQAPGGDIPAAMSAAMAASSMVIRRHAGTLAGKRGYADFDATTFADLLLDRAEKLLRFARTNAGPVLTDKLSRAEQDAIRTRRRQALRADGKVVEIGYRADPFDKIVCAASFLQRAYSDRDPNSERHWFALANEVYDNEYRAENNHDFWKDFGAGNLGKLAAYNLMRLAPTEEKFHNELQLYCCSFLNYKTTPGGLRLREWFAHEYGSLRHANNAAVIALYYSRFVEQSPPLQGNTWWKGNRTNPQLREQFQAAARSQVDYALGANPYGRSYLVGFGNRPFNNVHHRGAYGAWAGFDHFIPGKADDRQTARHILYGALVAGPDHNDVFLCGKDHLKWLPVPGTADHDFYYQWPGRTEPVRKADYTWSPADPPHQDIMDSQFNEVALDYNAGLTASLAWLCAAGLSQGTVLPDQQLAPRESQRLTTDPLDNDLEYFVEARRLTSTAQVQEIEATLWNRSRWPARVGTDMRFRYHYELGTRGRADQVQASVTGVPSAKATLGVDGLGPYVEVSFAGDAIYPGSISLASRKVVLRLTSPDWGIMLGDEHSLGPRREFRSEFVVYEGAQALKPCAIASAL